MIKNVPCQFPFILNGKTYDACTDETDPDGRFWCSTKVDRFGNIKFGHWGYCSDECFPSTQIQSGESFNCMCNWVCVGCVQIYYKSTSHKQPSY